MVIFGLSQTDMYFSIYTSSYFVKNSGTEYSIFHHYKHTERYSSHEFPPL